MKTKKRILFIILLSSIVISIFLCSFSILIGIAFFLICILLSIGIASGGGQSEEELIEEIEKYGYHNPEDQKKILKELKELEVC